MGPFKMYIEHSKMEDFIKVPKFFMTWMAAWPLGHSKIAWVYYLHSFVVAYTVSILFLISLFIGIYNSRDDFANFADATYFFMTELTFMIKFLIYSWKRKIFLSILDELESPIFNSYNQEQKKYLKKWSRWACGYSRAFFTSCMGCFVFFGLVPLMDEGEENILPFRGWFPFDVKTNMFNRTLVYCFQLLGLLVAIFINASLDVLPSIFMNFACSQIDILKENLENLTSQAEKQVVSRKNDDIGKYNKEFGENFYEILTNEQDSFVNNELTKLVKHHEAILKFLIKVEKLFTGGMFAQFVDSSITICITGFQLIVVSGKSVKFYSVIMYLTAKLIQISCYCWNGNEVTVLSKSISDSCYKMDWYRCSTKTKKTLFIIMERCKRPVHMTAGYFFILSIVTLTGVLRTSYSYFAVLRRVYQH